MLRSVRNRSHWKKSARPGLLRAWAALKVPWPTRAWACRPGHLVNFVCEGNAARIVWPAVPLALLYLVKMVARTPHRTAAAVVIAVFGDVELAGCRKGQAIGVAEAPGHQLGLPSGQRHPQYRARARNTALYHLPRVVAVPNAAYAPVETLSFGSGVSGLSD